MLNVILIGSNPFYDAYSQSDFLGKCIFLALLFLSILSWVILIQKTRTTRTMKKLSQQFQEIFETKRHHPLTLDTQIALQKTSFSNPFLEVYSSLKKHTLELLNKNHLGRAQENKSDVGETPSKVYLSPSDIDFVASHLTTAVSTQVKNLEKNLYVLSTIVTLGPFLGLLGTVWGILVTFSQLHSRASGQTNEVILSGLSMALGTTVLGLIVAIPALIAYNYLKNGVREFQTEIEDFSTLILATVEMQYRKTDVN
jgi:biopolymer transport protein TolQ